MGIYPSGARLIVRKTTNGYFIPGKEKGYAMNCVS